MIKESLEKARNYTKETFEKVRTYVRKVKIPTRPLVSILLLASFINIGLLYMVVYQGGAIYSSHVDEVVFAFKKQTTYDEVLFGIINNTSNKANSNINYIRNQEVTLNNHNDVLINHADVLSAQTKLLMDQNTVINRHSAAIKRLEDVVNNLQKELGYAKKRSMPETET